MRRAILLLAVVLGLAMPALAADPPADEGGTQSTTFQSRHKENLQHEPYVVGAYMAIWAGLFIYLRTLRTRQGKLDQDIQSLKDALARHDQDPRKAS